MGHNNIMRAMAWCALGAALAPGAALADEAGPPEDWNVHAQLTGIYQGYPRFHSPYRGPNSLSNDSQWRETVSGTLFLGGRLPWNSGELYLDPEVNQGFGVGHTLGIAGYVNGEAAKAGFENPKLNLARLFVRQSFGLGGEQEAIAGGANQLAGMQDVARVTVTAGKFSPTDIFDANQYSHDARTAFMNDSLWESVAWDYPADAKGYTDGVAVEFNQRSWTLRGGYFLVPKIANQRDLDPRLFKRYGTVAELEMRYALAGAPGVARLLAFANRAPQASLDQADALALATGLPAQTATLRRDSWKTGFAVNLEQSVTDALGVFSRLSWNDGRTEGWSFTDIDRSIAVGASLGGAAWGRPGDTVGLAGATNFISRAAQQFFALGGAGILVGDGMLAYAPEWIVETYYSLRLAAPATLSLDYQFVADPAFNRQRGPISVFAARIHLDY